MLIRVLSSPHAADDNLPWEYNPDGFLAWYDEVFREAYKRDVPPVDLMRAIDNLRGMGYVVEWDDCMYRGQAVPFTREQLVFVIETYMAGAFDMVHGSLPSCESDAKHFAENPDKYGGIGDYRCGAMNTVAINVAILWAQTEGKRVGDGMGTGDFPHWDDFQQRCNEFVEKQLAGDYNQQWPNFRDLAEKIVDVCWADYLKEAAKAKEEAESPFSDVGLELADGGYIAYPDEDGVIRRKDKDGNTEEVRYHTEDDWAEWRDLFPDDALYFQPEDAGDDGSTIKSFDVYRHLENAEKAHPDVEILVYTFCDIEKPRFLDVENPTYHDDSNDPRCDEE